MTQPKDKTLNMLRRTTFAVLFIAPLVSYFIPAILVMGIFTWSDITSDPGGFVSFLFMLINPYIGLTALVGWLGRTRVRASILLVASIIIGGSGAFLWYDLLVRDTSVFRFLGLLSVGILQWYGIIATAIVLLIVLAVERGISRHRTVSIFILGALMCSGCRNQTVPPTPIPENQLAA